MTNRDMKAILDGLQPDDRTRLYFNDKSVNKHCIEEFLLLCFHFSPDTGTVDIGRSPVRELLTVARSNVWLGLRLYEATILEGFDSEDFAKHTLDHSLLDSIEKL